VDDQKFKNTKPIWQSLNFIKNLRLIQFLFSVYLVSRFPFLLIWYWPTRSRHCSRRQCFQIYQMQLS